MVVTACATGEQNGGETGLDYFGARYFSAAQGRMTSPDAYGIDQHPEDPHNFQKALDAARAAANKLKETYGDKSKQYTDAQRAIDVYGKSQRTVAHEGSHVMDFMKVMGGAKPMTLYQTEMTAFQVNFAVLKDVPGGPSLGFRGGYTFLAPLSPEAESANRTELIKMLGGPDYGLTEKEQGGYPYVRP